MTSHTLNPLAAPAWVDWPARDAGEPASGATPRPDLRLVVPDRRLELRVTALGPAGAAAVGLALAAGFTLLWAFLLLGVVAPAGALP
jgi:hypothetical protein